MNKLLTAIFMMSGIFCMGMEVFATTSQVYGTITNGYGSGSSPSFINISNIGQGSGESDSLSFRSYSGVLALQTKAPALKNLLAIDNTMVFSNPSPLPSSVQISPNLTFKVTLSVGGGNTIGSVSYGISHVAGTPPVALRSDAVVDTVLTPNTSIIYRIAFPNAEGDTLLQSSNNYIYWYAKNNAGSDAIPAVYQIQVQPSVAPTIVITQPDAKGGFSGTLPEIAATVTGQSGVNASSIQIQLESANGTNVFLLTSSQNPAIYDAVHGLVSYKYVGRPLVANATYKLIISASDFGGTVGSSQLSFVVKGGAIADLVPYPSPCNPKVQPVTIRYILNASAEVSVNIYDTSRRLVKALITKEARNPGINEEKWSGDNFAGADLANGIYFCEVIAKDSDGEHRRYTSLAILGK
ncbi:MAG: hypothetical protein ABSH12_06650 [Endomicrobiales bacterium]